MDLNPRQAIGEGLFLSGIVFCGPFLMLLQPPVFIGVLGRLYLPPEKGMKIFLQKTQYIGIY